MHVFVVALLFAQVASAQPTLKHAAKDDAPDKILCRLTAPAGTRIPERICRTVEEWDRIIEANQKDLEESRRPKGACQINQPC